MEGLLLTGPTPSSLKFSDLFLHCPLEELLLSIPLAGRAILHSTLPRGLNSQFTSYAMANTRCYFVKGKTLGHKGNIERNNSSIQPKKIKVFKCVNSLNKTGRIYDTTHQLDRRYIQHLYDML